MRGLNGIEQKDSLGIVAVDVDEVIANLLEEWLKRYNRDFSDNLTIEKITKNWGGTFNFSMGIPFKNAVNEWRKNNGIIVHLTAYGENIETSDILNRIKSHKKDIMLIVGSKKVHSEFYSERISDYNLAIGNQPHSEIAALAVFLDRIYEGKELNKTFQNSKLKILPSKRRKTIIESDQIQVVFYV